MNTPDIIKKFMDHVTHESGKVISKRFGLAYLMKTIPDVVNAIMSKTEFLDDAYSIRERVFFLEKGITRAPICIVCGGNVHPDTSVGWGKAKVTDVCSKECWDTHPNKSELCKAACINRDEVSAKIKREQTMLSKYGVGYTLQRPEMKEKLKNRFRDNNPYAYECLSSYEWVHEEYMIKKRFLVEIAEELSCDFSTVGVWVERHGFEIRQTMGTSLVEKKCRDFVESLGVQVIPNTKKILSSKMELDIFVPDKKYAIEVDGVFWHSYGVKESVDDMRYHLDKTIDANSVGVTLSHFWCSEIENTPDIVFSMIRSRLGMTSKIYARKCIVKEIDTQDARNFLDRNHLSGFSPAKVYVGLICNDELVHVVTFGKSRYTKEHQHELIRSASKLNTTVVGGLGKCLSHYVKKYCTSGEKILSYADRRYSTGSSYVSVGFSPIGETDIGYWWVSSAGKVYHRSNFMKKVLSTKLPIFDPTKTEAENMFMNKYRRLWDCGSFKFEYIVK